MTSPKLISLLLCSLLACSVNAHAGPDSSSTEAQLVKSLQAINDNHLDIALNEADDLLRVNPNFKLAQLVKADLLMARAGAIDNIASAANAPHDKIEYLRDEARVRLHRVMSQSEAKLVPRFLWQMDPQQKYALVADTSRATLFVYENVNGEPCYVTDFYITIGKLGPYLQVSITPVIITNQMEWSNEQEQSERYALQQEVEQWRKDWSSLDTNNYLKHYSRDLPAAAWSTRHG